MHQKFVNIKRMVINAMLVAMYIALSFTELTFGGIKFSFSALPIVICGLAFGPTDGLVVGLLGEFIAQLQGPYGLTPTTPLWVAPAAVRGLFVGCCVRLLRGKFSADGLKKPKNQVVFYIICMISGLIVSCLNTFTFYVDSKIYGYYNYYAVFGVFWGRVALGLVSSLAMGLVAVPVVMALWKARLIECSTTSKNKKSFAKEEYENERK